MIPLHVTNFFVVDLFSLIPSKGQCFKLLNVEHPTQFIANLGVSHAVLMYILLCL